MSLECKYKKLLFGIGISSIEVSKQKLPITTSLYVYNKTYSKEIYPGVNPFSRVKEFRAIPRNRCLCRFPKKKMGFQKEE